MLSQNKLLLPLSHYVQITFQKQQGHAAALQVQGSTSTKLLVLDPVRTHL